MQWLLILLLLSRGSSMFYHLCHILSILSCLIYRVRPGRWRLLYNNRYMIYYHTNDVQDNLLRMASYSLSVQYSYFRL